jgi:hypothetical protein
MKRITTDLSKNNLALVQKPATSTQLNALIDEWLDYLRIDGARPKTLIDYQGKIDKFRWFWEEYHPGPDGLSYSQKLGNHPENVTSKEARAFASYLRTPTMFRWGVTGHSRQAANAAAPTRTPKTSKSSNYPLKSPPNSKKPPPKPKKWRSPANAKLQRPLLQPLCPALRHAEAKSQKHKINNSFNHFW